MHAKQLRSATLFKSCSVPSRELHNHAAATADRSSKLSALFSVEEPTTKLWLRDQAALRLTKPANTVTCDPIIDEVPQPVWHQSKHRQQRPRPTQTSGNAQGSSRLNAQLTGTNQNDAIGLIQTRDHSQCLPTGLRLQRRKLKHRLWITLQHKLHRAIAKVAVTIKQNQGMFRSLGHAALV